MRDNESIEIIEDYLTDVGFALYSLREDHGISYADSLRLVQSMNITCGYVSTESIKDMIGRS